MNKFSFCFNFSFIPLDYDSPVTHATYAFLCENHKFTIKEYLIKMMPFTDEAEIFFGLHRIGQESLTAVHPGEASALIISSNDINIDKVLPVLNFWRKVLKEIDSNLMLHNIYELSRPYNKDFVAIELELEKNILESQIKKVPVNQGLQTIYKV